MAAWWWSLLAGAEWGRRAFVFAALRVPHGVSTEALWRGVGAAVGGRFMLVRTLVSVRSSVLRWWPSNSVRSMYLSLVWKGVIWWVRRCLCRWSGGGNAAARYRSDVGVGFVPRVRGRRARRDAVSAVGSPAAGAGVGDRTARAPARRSARFRRVGGRSSRHAGRRRERHAGATVVRAERAVVTAPSGGSGGAGGTRDRCGTDRGL